MRHLGMDLGTKTLGLAMSDKSGLIASPYKLIRFDDVNDAVDAVVKIIDEEKVDVLVLGLPKNMNNSMGFAAQRSLDFKKLLEEKTNKEVHLVDERLSTVEATNVLISGDMSRKARKEEIDKVSAAIILDTYLRKVG
jgi:putative holliday junction resolvase